MIGCLVRLAEGEGWLLEAKPRTRPLWQPIATGKYKEPAATLWHSVRLSVHQRSLRGVAGAVKPLNHFGKLPATTTLTERLHVLHQGISGAQVFDARYEGSEQTVPGIVCEAQAVVKP